MLSLIIELDERSLYVYTMKGQKKKVIGERRRRRKNGKWERERGRKRKLKHRNV